MSIFDGLPDVLLATFGEAEPVVYQLAAGGSPLSIAAIFRYQQRDALDVPHVNTVMPALHIRTSDLPVGRKPGDTVTVRGISYVAREFRIEDDVGLMTEVTLEATT